MKGEFTAVIESAPEGGYWAICPEVPGANGQGETVAEAKESLKQAIILISAASDTLHRRPPEKAEGAGAALAAGTCREGCSRVAGNHARVSGEGTCRFH